MVVFITLISLSLYFKYFKKNTKNLSENMQIKEIEVNKNSSANYIDDINYTSLDTKGNEYQITAEQAEIDMDNPDVMFLENIIAYIYINNSDTIKITSDFGKYNTANFDTIFSKNVIVLYPGHKITGEYMDFSFLANLGTISVDVIHYANKTILSADRVEMNIATKDTEIFMNDNTKKVLIEGTK
mgnify:FL=1